jgi:hypothetical protein
MRRARLRFGVALFGTALMFAGTMHSAAAVTPPFDTRKEAMLVPITPRGWVDPLVSVGDMIGTYQFEALPDGISVRTGASGTIQAFVNHETSTVPFPYASPTPTNPEANQNDFSNSKVTRLTINRTSAKITAASAVIKSSQNFQRFCSNFLGTSAQGFSRQLLLTNEEAVDWVNRSGQAWPATIGASNARQAGVVVAYDPATGVSKPIWGMGRLNHENSLAVPGYGKPVVLSGDDTFTTTPAQSQLYSYIAGSASAVWNDTGRLWAFVSDTSGYTGYESFKRGETTSIKGHFTLVPKLIATGRNTNGTDLMAAQVPASLGGPYPPPPNDGSWQRDPNGVGIDGPQWVLQKWSEDHGVFKFVRLEDMAYDKRAGQGNVVYIVDSGRGSAGAVADGKSTNGRIWRMVLSKTDPTKVTSLRILIEGDDREVKTRSEIHQPDNIESTVNGLMITEDPGSSQQFSFTDSTQLNDARRTEARIWQYRFATRSLRVVARVDQSADEGTNDVDSSTRGALGAWEASGIIDVSRWFGAGRFLVTVQAHTLWVAKDTPNDGVGREGQPFTYKREGGQVLMLYIPGG